MFSANRDTSDVRVSPLSEVRFGQQLSTGAITGYASTWGGPPDSYGTVFAKGAFSGSLAEHARENTAPVMLWAHNKADLIGRWTSVREDEYGLFVEGRLNLETDQGRNAFNHLKAGDLSGLSVGVYMDTRKDVRRNGDGTATIVRADLFEISVVGVPANRRARIQQVRNLQSKAELVELLREGGLAKSAAQRIATSGWSGLSKIDEQQVRDLSNKLKLQTQQIRSLK